MEKLILINLLEPPEVKFADWIEISKQFTVTLSVAWQTLLWLCKREQESKYTVQVQVQPNLPQAEILGTRK